MMAVRYGMYKAHYWTWTNFIEEYNHVRDCVIVTRTHTNITHTTCIRTHVHNTHSYTHTEYTYTLISDYYLQGTNFCPGQEVNNVTTHDQVNHTTDPIIFDLGSDPGEKYPLK